MEPELRLGRALRIGCSPFAFGRSLFGFGPRMNDSEVDQANSERRKAGFAMPKELTWSDSEDIGILLSETHPELDPLAVRFTDLHKYVIALPGFKDDPAKSNEAKLEAIQMAWHAEVLDRTQG
jgi:FeS assembly protein IscX